MKLSRLKLEYFRVLPRLDVPLGSRLTLLLGANGSGKTTILDGIAIGLGEILSYLPKVPGLSFKKTGEIHHRDNRMAPFARITLQTTTGLVWDRLTSRDKSKGTASQIPPGHGIRALRTFLDQTVIEPLNADASFDLPVFVYYGVSRALLEVPLTRKGFPKEHSRLEALEGALNADSRFKSAFVWFYNKENEEHRLQKAQKSFAVTLKELDCVRQAIERVFPDLREPRIALNPLRFEVNQQGEWFNITQLSGGYKTLLGLVIDLSARMAMANPHREDPLAAEAIVMIDEIDLHLHPQWQQRIVGDLLRAFPLTQFILSTHSPFIVESVNNHLKRQAIDHLPMADAMMRGLLPLPVHELKAYGLSAAGVESLIDAERGLLDDRLLEPFNAISRLYEDMRDIEWAQRTA